MKKTLLFIMTAVVVCWFSSCNEKNAPSNNDASDENPYSYAKVNSIREFLSLQNNEEIVQIDNVVTVTYQNGLYLYVKDNSGALLVYGSINKEYKNGDQIKGICGRYYSYYGLPEMKVEESTFGGIYKGNAPVSPEVVSSLSMNDLSKYVKFENAQFTADVNFNSLQKTSGTLTNGILVHNYFLISANCSASKKYNVTGVVSLFKDEVEIYLISVELKTDGGGESGGGEPEQPTEEWVQVSASGYIPYWYCPSGGTTTPSTKQTSSHIDAYKNTSTGAYKVRWAYDEYAAHKGYNKIKLDQMSHTTYNSRTGMYGVCTDYFYYEFTIYE
ncbi:MAG: hypothetical protein IJQ32_07990 [Paludibacteraceae bacterium]|nr:hypothetical protein [Paludibacteraceae bacterium]